MTTTRVLWTICTRCQGRIIVCLYLKTKKDISGDDGILERCIKACLKFVLLFVLYSTTRQRIRSAPSYDKDQYYQKMKVKRQHKDDNENLHNDC